jgi:hypothetical protein
MAYQPEPSGEEYMVENANHFVFEALLERASGKDILTLLPETWLTVPDSDAPMILKFFASGTRVPPRVINV